MIAEVGFIEKVSGNKIQVQRANVERLPAESTALKTAGNSKLRFRPRTGDGIGKRGKARAGMKPAQGGLVFLHRLLEHARGRLPRIAMGKRVTPQFMPVIQQRR